ncbi:MAG: ATP-binding cassette domain-containing protein [Clostridia bacterium]|nr:ATP-binding cassette domain-containing protein [Clostridia bacterium]
MLKFEKVSLTFKTEGREQHVLKDLSYTFETGRITAITGVSGIGKTTILNLAAGLLETSEGSVINTFAKTAYVFQEPRLLPWKTALENVTCVCGDEKKAKFYLDILLPEGSDKYPDELSGGMQQRVSIARAMAYDAELVLLDEALKGLDMQTKDAVVKTLREHLKGRTAIMITHDKSELEFCDTVLEISDAPISELKHVNR